MSKWQWGSKRCFPCPQMKLDLTLPSKTVSGRSMIIPWVNKAGFSLTYEAITSGFLWFYKSAQAFAILVIAKVHKS